MKAENFIRLLISTKALFLSAFVFILAFSSLAHAQTNVFDLVQVNEDLAQSYGSEVVAKLHQFRAEVEKSAYLTTMQLCQGYRIATGKGLVKGHADKMFSAEASIQAWGNIFKAGLLVPVSGLKAEFNGLKHIPPWYVSSWFLSMYSLYLVNSMGFLSASVHCLNSTNQRDIYYFADAILNADLVGTTVSYAVSTKILTMITQPLRFVFRPAHYAYQLLAQKMAPYMPMKVLLGSVIVPIAVDNLSLRLEQMQVDHDEFEKAEQQVVVEKPLSPEDQARRLRFMTLNRGLNLMIAALRDNQDAQAQQNMKQFIADELTPEKLTLYNADHSTLENTDSDHQTDSQKHYLKVLQYMLPVLTAAAAPRPTK
jgi:hypothetical protein